ncbi:hypothetical protein [Gordonia aichiensis]|uniref:Uncharacterized protein n=1 Tax=Gordonia aichiensis NBRC 108223 TaxID=1220583 RepID=L7KL56_9ACTN|nr:hypothetical protein [Gordonia aichiensis]GAC49226.1 hypothetical protein GOACH_11_00210 [Gordonia aichiensis NBRC 108223]
MKLAATFQTPRRHSMLSAITGGRFGRHRVAQRFPAEAERLVTAAELKRLTA